MMMVMMFALPDTYENTSREKSLSYNNHEVNFVIMKVTKTTTQ